MRDPIPSSFYAAVISPFEKKERRVPLSEDLQALQTAAADLKHGQILPVFLASKQFASLSREPDGTVAFRGSEHACLSTVPQDVLDSITNDEGPSQAVATELRGICQKQQRESSLTRRISNIARNIFQNCLRRLENLFKTVVEVTKWLFTQKKKQHNSKTEE